MKGYFFIGCIFFLSPLVIRAQEKPSKWDLKNCIEYAYSQNIRIKKSKLTLEEGLENTRQAKSQLFPSLSFSSGHNLVNHPKNIDTDKNSYTASYGLNSSVTLYGGGILRKNIEQQQLQNKIDELSVQEAEDNIEIAITQSYLQVLYAVESVKINENTLEVSGQQLKRTRELLAAGSVSQSDLAQIESQYSSDKYQLVVARSALDENKLTLKQLLELGITEEMDLVIPELSDEQVLLPIPSKLAVYEASLGIMPQIESGKLAVDMAGIEKAKAKAGYLPTLDLSASLGTGHISGTDYSFPDQLKDRFNESLGLTLNIPVFSNRKNKTAVKIAQLNIDQSQLDYQNVQKDLLTSIESVYQDALSSQNRFKAATESLRSARLSYELMEEKYNIGLKNTLELLTEKNNFLSAQQEVLQAKYMTVLNQQLLNFYQGKEMTLTDDRK